MIITGFKEDNNSRRPCHTRRPKAAHPDIVMPDGFLLPFGLYPYIEYPRSRVRVRSILREGSVRFEGFDHFIYFVLDGDILMYVGESVDLFERVYGHKTGKESLLHRDFRNNPAAMDWRILPAQPRALVPFIVENIRALIPDDYREREWLEDALDAERWETVSNVEWICTEMCQPLLNKQNPMFIRKYGLHVGVPKMLDALVTKL